MKVDTFNGLFWRIQIYWMHEKKIKKTTLQRQGNSTTMLSKGYASLSGVIWPVMTPWISPQMRFVFCENNNQMSERIYLSLCMFAFLLSLSMVTALLLGMLLWLFSTSLWFKMKYLSHWIANFFFICYSYPWCREGETDLTLGISLSVSYRFGM